MSNECRRIITLHALTEIHGILLTYAGRGMVAVLSLIPRKVRTGKVIYKPSVVDDKQLHLKQD